MSDMWMKQPTDRGEGESSGENSGQRKIAYKSK